MYRSHGTEGTNRAYWSAQYAPVFPLIRQALALRLALAPYLYTAARQAHDSGTAAVRALYIDAPEEEASYSNNQTFMHGDSLLVRPITQSMEPGGGSTRMATVPCRGGQSAPCISVWLPPSTIGWVYWGGGLGGLYTGVPASGGDVVVEGGRGELPLFVRSGAVVPLLPVGSLDATAAGAKGTGINWALFTGAEGTAPMPPCHNCPPSKPNCFPCPPDTGSGTRYFDDGDSTAYEGKAGRYATQTFNFSLTKNPHRIKATIGAAVAVGGFTLPASHRVLHTVELRGRHAPNLATADGVEMNCTVVGWDPTAPGGGKAVPGADLARPEGTTMCVAGAAGLAETMQLVFEW